MAEDHSEAVFLTAAASSRTVAVASVETEASFQTEGEVSVETEASFQTEGEVSGVDSSREEAEALEVVTGADSKEESQSREGFPRSLARTIPVGEGAREDSLVADLPMDSVVLMGVDSPVEE